MPGKPNGEKAKKRVEKRTKLKDRKSIPVPKSAYANGDSDASGDYGELEDDLGDAAGFILQASAKQRLRMQ